jgi:hypothetical protein
MLGKGILKLGMNEFNCITEVEYLADRALVHYHLRKPFGLLDEDGTKDIPYSLISCLQLLPEKNPGLGEENFWIEKMNTGHGVVAFLFDMHMEVSWGPWEQDIYGPYRLILSPSEQLKLDLRDETSRFRWAGNLKN